jgi:hypothetical protein
MESTKPQMIRPISMSSINIGMRKAWNRTPDKSGVLSPVTYAAALTACALMKVSKSAFMISACVVGMPCGSPG